MHGLMNRAIQGFVHEAYGPARWAEIARDIGLDAEGFEALMHYDDAMTEAALDSAARHLSRSRDAVLEDLGTFLVSGMPNRALRRLLRFGGPTFADFIHSLEELPGRARLALPDLDLPHLRLEEPQPDVFELYSTGYPGIGLVLMGMLRAMADDYGALVLLDHRCEGSCEIVTTTLLEASYAAGSRFDLAAREA
jgi:hypothetical protein